MNSSLVCSYYRLIYICWKKVRSLWHSSFCRPQELRVCVCLTRFMCCGARWCRGHTWSMTVLNPQGKNVHRDSSEPAASYRAHLLRWTTEEPLSLMDCFSGFLEKFWNNHSEKDSSFFQGHLKIKLCNCPSVCNCLVNTGWIFLIQNDLRSEVFQILEFGIFAYMRWVILSVGPKTEHKTFFFFLKFMLC